MSVIQTPIHLLALSIIIVFGHKYAELNQSQCGIEWHSWKNIILGDKNCYKIVIIIFITIIVIAIIILRMKVVIILEIIIIIIFIEIMKNLAESYPVGFVK